MAFRGRNKVSAWLIQGGGAGFGSRQGMGIKQERDSGIEQRGDTGKDWGRTMQAQGLVQTRNMQSGQGQG